VTRALILSAATFALAACSGGAGTLPIAPGVDGSSARPTAPATPTPSPSPVPTPSPGPIVFGTPAFPQGGAAGACATQVTFNAGSGSATAVVPIAESNYAGAFRIATNSAPTVASAAVTGDVLTVLALAAGTTTVTIADDHGGAATCAIGVTTTAGTVQ
jgi:hypothetical protein